jgi:hypothetical protein
MLSGAYPGMLYDQEGKLPHQRANVANSISSLAGDRISAVNGLFDRSFALNLSERFQNISELRAALTKVRADSSPPTMSLHQAVEHLNANPAYRKSEQITKLIQQLCFDLNHAHRQMATGITTLGPFAWVAANGVTEHAYASMELGIKHEVIPKIIIMPRFQVNLVGAQLVVTATLSEEVEEIARFDIDYVGHTHDMQDKTRAYLDRKLTECIAKHIS